MKDELKKQVTADEADFTEDAEVQQLLSSLRDIPAPAETQASDSEEENEAPTESEEPDEAQNYKSIYDDVLRAVSESKPAEEEVTGRRSKFLSGKGQFVDVTEHYQEYADLTPQSEKMPEAPAAQPSESEEAPRAAEPEKQYFFENIPQSARHGRRGDSQNRCKSFRSGTCRLSCLLRHLRRAKLSGKQTARRYQRADY